MRFLLVLVLVLLRDVVLVLVLVRVVVLVLVLYTNGDSS